GGRGGRARASSVRSVLVRAVMVRAIVVRAVMVRRQLVLVGEPPMSGAARRQSIIRAFITVLAVSGAGLLVPLAHRGSVSTNPRPSLIALIVLFAVAESCVVHVYVNRQAHTFSLSEIPLLIGLAYLSPVALALGR